MLEIPIFSFRKTLLFPLYPKAFALHVFKISPTNEVIVGLLRLGRPWAVLGSNFKHFSKEKGNFKLPAENPRKK